jgi:hypothetical protein
VDFAGVRVDAGASWIHGPEGNPLTPLADAAGIRRLPTYEARSVVFDAAGARLDEARQARLFARLEDLTDPTSPAAWREERDTSLAEAVPWLTAAPEADPFERQMTNWLNSFVAGYAGADASEQSALAWFGGDGDVPDENHILREGFSHLLAHVARGLDVRTRQQVTMIAHDREGVTVRTLTQVLRADRCVVTLPLGVLKHGNVTFDPPLPAVKQGAIARIGTGLLNKIMLAFPRAFWPADVDYVRVLAERNPNAGAEILNLSGHLGAPVLIAIVGGSAARGLERLPDAANVAPVMRALRTAFGNGIPQPTAVRVTRWGRDVFARGAYCYLPVGAAAADHAALAAPVADRLFFAGEAATVEKPSYVHGALLGGRRAAEEILATA